MSKLKDALYESYIFRLLETPGSSFLSMAREDGIIVGGASVEDDHP